MIKNRKSYNIYLSGDLFERGTKLAKKNGQNLSWILNELLREKLQNEKCKKS